MEMILTCKSWHEAQDIADNLLKQQIARTVEFMEPLTTAAINDAREGIKDISLIIETTEANFAKVEEIVRNLK